MLKHLTLLFFSLITLSVTLQSSADISIKELIFSDDKPFHLKLLEAIPKEAKIEYGPEDAENTIIEFMDYFCGFCKKIHPELIKIVDERNDVKVIFLHHPILSQNSVIISKFVIAANFQNKGFELHHSIFSMPGSITQEKLEEAIIKSGINKTQLNIDIGKPKIDQMIQLSSFLAGGAGVRGTPSLFVNEELIGGYIEEQQIINLLK